MSDSVRTSVEAAAGSQGSPSLAGRLRSPPRSGARAGRARSPVVAERYAGQHGGAGAPDGRPVTVLSAVTPTRDGAANSITPP